MNESCLFFPELFRLYDKETEAKKPATDEDLRSIADLCTLCGMGGSLGFKESFYEKSVELGRPLFQKIEAASPEAIITDCLSCRLQFEHILSYKVFHPLEVLSRAYESADLKPI